MKNLRSISRNKGFTLLEILLVVAAIAILATVIILALNPNKQLGDTRNAKRNIDKDSITKAVTEYQIDHGNLPGPDAIPTTLETAAYICKTGQTTTEQDPCINLSNLTDNNTYLSSIPIDPNQPLTSPSSGYQIYLNSANNRIVILAPNTETSGGGEVIPPSTPGFTLLHTFTGNPDGANPQYGSLIRSGSTFYGMTYGGGTSNAGTLFSSDLSGNVTTLHSFTGSDGSYPEGSLILSGSTLYGMTYQGGSSNAGTIFKFGI